MRQRFNTEPDLNVIPIEKLIIPLHSRDELPPILAGLQWIWTHPTLRAALLDLLEKKVLAHKQATGRWGMELWQILVLGVVRLGLDANCDRLEDLANHHALMRQMLGVTPFPWGEGAQVFNHQTLRDNVALVDEALLQEINARVAAAGREVFRKKAGAPAEPLAIKVDTYALETDVHFPTDLNLLFDAGRKSLDLIEKYRDTLNYELPGWRKLADRRTRFKAAERQASKVVFGGGQDKEKRVAETEREQSRKFVALRQAHSAVESDINALEHHGLDRCLDVGLEGFKRYVGYGVLAFNLHQIGRELLERQRTGLPFQTAA